MGKRIALIDICKKSVDRLQMTRSRTSLRDSQPGSPSPHSSPEEDNSDARSLKAEQASPRGRKGQVVADDGEAEPMDTTG